MRRHDIVVLSETHRKTVKHAPGFIGYAANNPHSSRGGLAVLFSQAIHTDLVEVKTDLQEQIWFKLRSVPNVVFCGAYIAPSDSAYYTEESFARIEANTVNYDLKYVIMGDMNTRCGSEIRDLLDDESTMDFTPCDNEQNKNGIRLLNICKANSLLPLNNLHTGQKSFDSTKTFRKRNNWISELDYCVVSQSIAKTCASSFSVIADVSLPLCKLSDHAPVSVNFCFPVDSRTLLERAASLCEHACEIKASSTKCKDPIPMRMINQDKFRERLQSLEPPAMNPAHPDIAVTFTDCLYNIATECRSTPKRAKNVDPSKSRWQRITECEDSKALWKAIDWKGNFNPSPIMQRPGDAEFQHHMEELLNPPDRDTWPSIDDTQPTISVLDDHFTVPEVEKVVKDQMIPNKSSGPDGVSPGIFRLFPIQWLVYLTLLLNMVFVSGSYPSSWCSAKLSMLFKKGSAFVCDNYRGISIINSLTKLYDYVLNNRLMLWYKPCREQAGAQPKRGCTEHLITLRFIIEYARYKKVKLFITYVDFSKAYDRVPRGKMFHLLKSLGCGLVMLTALMALYSSTLSILGTAVITATIGVRQGSPTSCFLFVLFVDALIRRLKRLPDDGWLQWLHSLMLMDDTVIFATTRERMAEKLQVLENYCTEYGMIVNESKTKFMAINGDDTDQQPFHVGDFSVRHCERYTYLGVIITSDGSPESSLKAHVDEKMSHLNKLIIFLAVNYDAPFYVKKKVFDAAFSSSILYSCECWLKVPLRSIEALYMTAVKSLLGVRPTACNDICLLEAGIPSVTALIRSRQAKFLSSIRVSRANLQDDPLMFALRLIQANHKPLHTRVEDITNSTEHLAKDLYERQSSVRDKNGSKLLTYKRLNPLLDVHKMYSEHHTLPDNLRTCFTRFRTSSHRLRIEMGRWSRIPSPLRTCQCDSGDVQDEEHVFKCPLTAAVRQQATFNGGCKELFENATYKNLKMLKDCMEILEK